MLKTRYVESLFLVVLEIALSFQVTFCDSKMSDDFLRIIGIVCNHCSKANKAVHIFNLLSIDNYKVLVI